MSTQPEALRLADLLEQIDGQHWQVQDSAAAELRRLHAELERCKQVCAATAEEWRNESERMTDTHLKQGLTIAELYAQRDALLEALKWIADHDLLGTDLMVAGHMAHGFIGRARAAVSAFEGEKT